MTQLEELVEQYKALYLQANGEESDIELSGTSWFKVSGDSYRTNKLPTFIKRLESKLEEEVALDVVDDSEPAKPDEPVEPVGPVVTKELQRFDVDAALARKFDNFSVVWDVPVVDGGVSAVVQKGLASFKIGAKVQLINNPTYVDLAVVAERIIRLTKGEDRVRLIGFTNKSKRISLTLTV